MTIFFSSSWSTLETSRKCIKTFFGECPKFLCKDLFLFWGTHEILQNICDFFGRRSFFVLFKDHLQNCVLGFLALSSRIPVFGPEQ